MEELKPCQFCGSKKIGVEGSVDVIDVDGIGIKIGCFFANCKNCKASGPMKPTKQDAIDAWNKRS